MYHDARVFVCLRHFCGIPKPKQCRSISNIIITPGTPISNLRIMLSIIIDQSESGKLGTFYTKLENLRNSFIASWDCNPITVVTKCFILCFFWIVLPTSWVVSSFTLQPIAVRDSKSILLYITIESSTLILL